MNKIRFIPDTYTGAVPRVVTEDSSPIAVVPAKVKCRGRGRMRFYELIIKCPFCGKRHTHGGGDDGENILYGWRVSHCNSKIIGDYYLYPEGELSPHA